MTIITVEHDHNILILSIITCTMILRGHVRIMEM